MLQWILKYIMENISDDKSWNVIAQIKKFGQNIFKDYYKEVSLTLEQKMGEEGFFENYTTTLREPEESCRRLYERDWRIVLRYPRRRRLECRRSVE